MSDLAQYNRPMAVVLLEDLPLAWSPLGPYRDADYQGLPDELALPWT